MIWPFSRRAEPAPSNTAAVAPLPQGVEIDYSEVEKMLPDLVKGPIGDGTDGKGRRFSIVRYTSRKTGKRYDVVDTAGGGTRCIEWPRVDEPRRGGEGR